MSVRPLIFSSLVVFFNAFLDIYRPPLSGPSSAGIVWWWLGPKVSPNPSCICRRFFFVPSSSLLKSPLLPSGACNGDCALRLNFSPGWLARICCSQGLRQMQDCRTTSNVFIFALNNENKAVYAHSYSPAAHFLRC